MTSYIQMHLPKDQSTISFHLIEGTEWLLSVCSYSFHYLQKQILFEVFPDAVIVRATGALFWPEMPTVFFWENKHLVQTPSEEGAQLSQQFGKSSKKD